MSYDYFDDTRRASESLRRSRAAAKAKKERRKKLCTVNIKDVEMVAPTGSPEIAMHKGVQTLNYSSKMPNAETSETSDFETTSGDDLPF